MKFTDLRDALRTQLKLQIAEGSTTGLAIAAAANARQAHISNFLNGKRGLSFELADRLLEIAGLDSEDLIAEQLVSPRRPFQPTTVGAFITVPMIEPSAAMRPRAQQRDVKGSLLIPQELLGHTIANNRRARWARFVALRLKNHECIAVDRHSFEPSTHGRFLIIRNGMAEVGRLLQAGRRIVFCPELATEEIFNVDRVVGRVVLTQTWEG